MRTVYKYEGTEPLRLPYRPLAVAFVGLTPEHTHIYHLGGRLSTYQLQSTSRRGELKPNEFAKAITEHAHHRVVFVSHDTPDEQDTWMEHAMSKIKKADLHNLATDLLLEAKPTKQMPDLKGYDMWAHARTGTYEDLSRAAGIYLTKLSIYIKDENGAIQVNGNELWASPIKIKTETISRNCASKPFAFLPIHVWNAHMSLGDRINGPDTEFGLIAANADLARLWATHLAFARLNLGMAEYSMHAGRSIKPTTAFPIPIPTFDPFEL